MKKLMISLDKKIMDKNSAAAARMIKYGKVDELFIIIPDNKKQSFNLSDRVWVESTGGNKIAQYFRLKKLAKMLVKDHDIKFITVQDPSFSGNIGRWLKNKIDATLEVQLHGDFYGSDFYKKTLKDNLGYFFFGKKNIRAADKVRVVSERVKQGMLGLGVDERKIEVKPVPIFEDNVLVTKHQIDVKKAFPGHEKYFLFVGRLEEVKNLAWLIEIFEEIVLTEYGRDFFLLVLGEGSQKNELRALVDEKKLQKNIKFKGWLTDAWNYYASVDCVLFPSLSEGYGLVPMEAAVAGAKIIMSDVGVANYELEASKRVKIIPLEDRQAWIEAILNI